MWKNCIEHIVDEDVLWNMDIVVDELTPEQEPRVMNLNPDESDSDSESNLGSDNNVRSLSDV